MPKSVTSSPHHVPPAQLFLFLRGEACIVTVVSWSVVYFYCLFIYFFLLLLITIFPRSSAQRPHQERVCVPAATSPSRPTPPPVSCDERCDSAPSRVVASTASLCARQLRSLELNRVVAIADVGLFGSQCWKERQTSHVSLMKSTLPFWLPSCHPDLTVVPGDAGGDVTWGMVMGPASTGTQDRSLQGH